MKFSSEWISWKAVLQARWRSIVFFSILSILLMELLFGMTAQLRLFSDLSSHVTSQVEVFLELRSDLSADQLALMEEDLKNLPMVKSLEYWDPQKTAAYADQWLIKGYTTFLQKSNLENPFPPLLRVQLKSLGKKASFQKILSEKYPALITIADQSLSKATEGFASTFIRSLSISFRVFYFLIAFQILVIFFVLGFLSFELISERKKGFHPFQVLHLSPPYEFFPALFIVGLLTSLILFFGGFLAAFIFSGSFIGLSIMILAGTLMMLSILLYFRQ